MFIYSKSQIFYYIYSLHFLMVAKSYLNHLKSPISRTFLDSLDYSNSIVPGGLEVKS